MTRTDRIDIALAALVDLQKRHEKFLEFLGACCDSQPRAGIIAIKGNEIQVICLGVSLRCEARPVTDGGEFAAYEYAFFATHRGEEILVFTMFLKPDDTLTRFAVLGPQICSSTNEYIATRITDAIANQLMDSPVFRATAG